MNEQTRRDWLREAKQQASRISIEQIEAGREAFLERFVPAQLRLLEGNELLEAFHGKQPREGLFYELEFGKLVEAFGSIGGGTALKYKVYRAESGEWRTGSAAGGVRECSIEEAIALTRQLADSLWRAYDLSQELPLEKGDKSAWERFQTLIAEEHANRFQKEGKASLSAPTPELGWAHKYLAILQPAFSLHHSSAHLARHLVRLGMKPETKRYLLDWQWRDLCLRDRELKKLHPVTLMRAAYALFGHGEGGARYWRVEVEQNGRIRWPEMHSGSYVSFEDPTLGDLSETLDDKNPDLSALKETMAKYDVRPSEASRRAQQAYAFYSLMKPGDRIVATHHNYLMGLGLVESDYEYRSEGDSSHRRAVKWLDVPQDWLESFPAKSASLSEITDNYAQTHLIETLLSTRSSLVAETPASYHQHEPPPPLPPLYAQLESILNRKGQAILQGAPGTGKTYHARRASRELMARRLFCDRSWDQLLPFEQEAVEGRILFCAFHPAYAYEDFVEGYRPVAPEEPGMPPGFVLKDGIFLEACQRARQNPESPFVLIIDEFNRANLSAVLGELMTLLEIDKRETLSVLLPLSRRAFSVPRNLWVIGTMNLSDRSASSLDLALRRRFGFIELAPDPGVLNTTIEQLSLSDLLQTLNARLARFLSRSGREPAIGHAYFMRDQRPLKSKRELKEAMQEEIMPLLLDYCFGDLTLLHSILSGDFVDLQNRRLHESIFDDENALYTAFLDLIAQESGDENAL